MSAFLIYGANGYTGELIARFAKEYGLQPILAGRNASAIQALAQRLNLPYRIIDLSDSTALEQALREVKVVVHAAGPFQATAKAMVEACLATGTHYLDINGDIAVFELIKSYDAAARNSGIMLLPGTGFDVVPTDCLAHYLHTKMPDATDLTLAFATLGGAVSHGTATTVATKLGEGGARRVNGIIVRAPLGRRGQWIDFGQKKLFAMSIPWGDVSTAHFSTGIPNIETMMGVPPRLFYLMKFQWLFNWLLRRSFVRLMIQQRINRAPAGPSDAQRELARSLVWGQVSNSAGQTLTARLSGPEGYTTTFHATLLIVKKVLEGHFTTGYQTPSSAYGADLVLAVPGMQRFD